MADSRRVYRWLLRLYPAAFREDYGGPLERQFADEYRDAGGARLVFWLRVLKDLAIWVPYQTSRETAQDLRYGFRAYRKRWLVTLLALGALTLGIGATTGVFSVLNAVLLRALPFRDAEQLVELTGASMKGRTAFRDWVGASPFLTDATAYSTADVNLEVGGESVRTKVAQITAGFFQTLGTAPAIGRPFTPDEDAQGSDSVAVISNGLWQQLFAGAPEVLGKSILLNATPMMVVGVAPPGFDYPAKAAVWIPTVFDYPKIPTGGVIFWKTLGRLKPEVSFARASSIFAAETASRNSQLPKGKGFAGFAPVRAELIPLRDQLAGPVRQASLVLLGVVGFVLLIACANVAHLLLSRFAERRQELAIRAALGASRARLTRQMITESTLLTVCASAGGLVVANWVARVAAAAQPAQLSAQSYTVLDWRVLLFALAAAAATGLVFGVLPAFLARRMQPTTDPARSQSGAGSGVSRMRSGLIAVQAALTLVLVAGSFLMGRAFLRILGTDLGFRTDHMVTLNVSLSGTRYAANHLENEYYRQALERLQAVPGVQSAAAAQFLPLVENSYMGQDFTLDPAHRAPMTLTLGVSAGYFQTMGTRVLEGREFTAADRSGSELVMVVNQKFVEQLGIGPNVIGKRVTGWNGNGPYTIVGVVADESLMGASSRAHQVAYFPFGQRAPGFATLVARVRGQTEPYLGAGTAVVRQVDPRIPVYDVKTLDQRLAENVARPKFYTTAILFLAVFALGLALIGIYGMATYAIAQRTHEIGVRLAVGAAVGDVRLMLLRQSLAPLAVGLVAGVAASFALANSLQHLIHDAPAMDWQTCGGASLLLGIAAAVAVWGATRKILRVDPMGALRAD